MVRKLKSKSGETITEVLVAALVVVFGVLLYTMMVQSSFRIIKTSDDAMKDLYDTESMIESGEADIRYQSNPFVISKSTGGTIDIAYPEPEEKKPKVKIYGNDDVMAYSLNN